MKRRICFDIAAITIIMMLGVCGCSMGNSDIQVQSSKEVVTLNDRQIDILLQNGLKTDYEELTARQKKAIVAIEEMLCETEKKYGVSFGYISYSDGGVLGSEELTAYPVDGEKDRDIFVITRSLENGSYVYSDGYSNLVAKPVFNEFILEYAAMQTGIENVKVYSVVTNISNNVYPVTPDDIANNVSGNSWIFIDGSEITEKRFDEFLADYEKWKKQNGIGGSTQIILLNNDVLKYITEYNYSDYLSPVYYSRREFCNS